MPRTRFVCLIFVAALSLAAFAQAADAPGKLTLKTERVIAFKDGYCLVIKRGEAAANEQGQLYLDDVPDAAVLGSFWATPTQGRLVHMVAGWKEAKEETEKEFLCKETIELLLANQGQIARVEMHDKTIHSGTIHEVLVERTPTPLAADAQLSSILPPEVRTITALAGANFILRTGDGDVLLQAGQVRSLTVKEMKTKLPRTIATSRRTRRLMFQFDEARQKQELRLMYFRPGVRWIPSYRVDLDDKDKKKVAQIALQAELLNEAEDFAGAPVDIVVGVPNFRFRQTPSPLVLESVLRNALLDSDPNLMGNGSNTLSNAMYTQRSSEFRRDAALANAAAQQGTIDLPNELKAAGTQDLFVYQLPKLTIGKGERAAVPIFSAAVPYRDIYTWDVHVQRPDIDAAPSGAGIQSPLTLAKNEVWHQIELTNATTVPWTTGAALIMQGRQPVSQELLTYTPIQSEVRMPVTVSVDTRGTFSEKEVARELNSLTWDHHQYARIDKLATLHLCNHKPVEIEIEITLRLGGKADEASHEGAVTLGAFDAADWVQYQGHPAVNNSSRIVWRVKLKPGETFEPTVKYHYFTRN